MKSKPITKESKRAMILNDVFGSHKEAVAKIREMLDLTNAEDDFLTDEIITAPLHVDVATKMSEECLDLIYSNDKNISEKAKKCFAYRLCGSICHALSSRVKNDKYAQHRDIDWLKMSKDFQFVAGSTEIHLKISKMK